MSLVLFGAPAGTNVLVRLDNPGLFLDEGAAIPQPYFVPANMDFGPAGGEGRLRRITQAVTTGGANSVEVTPIANGSEVSSQAETFPVNAVDGSEQRIEHNVASVATRHAMRIAVTALGGMLSFGECDVLMVPKRTTERA